MIFPSNRVRIMVATKPVDFRNYVEWLIMRSPPQACQFTLSISVG